MSRRRLITERAQKAAQYALQENPGLSPSMLKMKALEILTTKPTEQQLKDPQFGRRDVEALTDRELKRARAEIENSLDYIMNMGDKQQCELK